MLTETRLRPLSCLGTLAIASAGGAVAALIGVPLPWLIGALVALCIAAMMRVEIFGAPPQWPGISRDVFLPVLGVLIGSAFTPSVLNELPHWWRTALLLTVFLVAAHVAVYALFRRFGGYDRTTAFYAAFPGGFVEATVMGQAAGADHRLVLVQHFLRISLIVLLMPLFFWWWSGGPVGSAAGVTGPRSANGLGPGDMALLLAGAVVATIAARRLRFPAPDISGGILASATLYIGGWVDGRMPWSLVVLTQLMVGTSLGVGFVGVGRREVGRAIGLALAAFALVFAMAASVALLAGPTLGAEPPAVLLAFMPGGLAEMSLIAISLRIDTPFVALHHLFRILFCVTVLPRLSFWRGEDG